MYANKNQYHFGAITAALAVAACLAWTLPLWGQASSRSSAVTRRAAPTRSAPSRATAAVPRAAAPRVSAPRPSASRPSTSSVVRSAPRISRTVPQISRSTPRITRPTPQITRPTPQASRPAPQISRPAPQISRPAPQVSRTPSLNLQTRVPSTSPSTSRNPVIYRRLPPMTGSRVETPEPSRSQVPSSSSGSSSFQAPARLGNVVPRLNPNIGPSLTPNIGPQLNPNIGPQLPDITPELSPNASLTPRVSPQLSQSIGGRIPQSTSSAKNSAGFRDGTSTTIINRPPSRGEPAERIYSSVRSRQTGTSASSRGAAEVVTGRSTQGRDRTSYIIGGPTTTPSQESRAGGTDRTPPDRSTSQSESLLGRLRESQRRYPTGKAPQTGAAGPIRPNTADDQAPAREPEALARRDALLRQRISDRRTDAGVVDQMPSIVDAAERVRVAGREVENSRPGLATRLDDYARRTDRPLKGDAQRFLDERVQRRPQIVYRDRPDLVRSSPRNVYVYRDSFDRLCERIIWPQYYYPVYYSYGPYLGFRHVYPYYHRKYVFVSLGGYWPTSYSYLRYYWYGYHPYTWYGYYPVPRQITSDTYNYYTYNYYTDYADNYADTGYYSNDTGRSDLPYGVSAETYAKVQQRVAEQQQAQGPSAQTQVDTLFDGGVTDFEAGNYDAAAAQFGAAMELAPNDMILPYAYAQSLFASERYDDAAQVLREALSDISPSEEGVFYPRGLYADDDVLFAQVEELLDQVETYSFDADIQLLLGYNLLGIGETEYARGPLERAAQDTQNARAAEVLLDLVEKLEAAAVSNGAAAAAPVETYESAAGAVDSGPTAVSTPVRPEREADTNELIETPAPAEGEGVTPSRPAPTEPDANSEPETLGIGTGAFRPDSAGSVQGKPAERDAAAAGLIGRTATPAMIGLVAAAAFCLVHADLLRHRRWPS